MDREEAIRCFWYFSNVADSGNNVVVLTRRDKEAFEMAIEALSTSEIPNKWIPVSERLPETDNENNINNYDVLLWVKNKTYPEREPQIYIGKLRRVDGDDGSGNFWGMETKPCEWTIWGWSYFIEPEVVAWMPLPEPYMSENPTGSNSEEESEDE